MSENVMEQEVIKLQTLLPILKAQIVASRQPVEGVLHSVCDYKTDNTLPDPKSMQPFGREDIWGKEPHEHGWFYFHITLPKAAPHRRYELRVETNKVEWNNVQNPQFILYVNGKMQQGMDVFHRTALLREEENEVFLYAYTGSHAKDLIFQATLEEIDERVEKLYYHLSVPANALAAMHHNTKEYTTIASACNQALLLLDMRKMPSEAFYRSVEDAVAYMDREFYGKVCRPGDISVVGIGHTHIDCAWLWTLQQSREKVQRSFSSVLELMRRYPDYKFMSSQALLYKYLKEEAPEVYEEVKQRIREGRWEVEGAMWVEADCNLTSGESLVRQVIHGKRFFRKEFGVESRVLWLPDVFGYSAALPQILKKAGVEWFLTSKISWNEKNMMPYDVFRWRGLDGTEIPTYFLTAQDKGASPEYVRYATYVGNTKPTMVAGTWNRFQQKHLTNEAILTFGYGDGGGGPTAEMLEILEREKKGIPGIPTAKNSFAGEFLQRLADRIEADPTCPKWQGELYLEFHRGTYTSQARNKKNNRECEFLYQNTEFLSELSRVLLDRPYPAEKLEEGWEMILTNQFHDIIPGSSIREVYEQCERDYAHIRSLAEPEAAAAREAIVGGIRTNKDIIVFNPHSFLHSGAVKVDGKSVWVENIPAKGYAAVKLPEKQECDVSLRGRVVETPHFRVRFDEKYHMVSLYDKKNFREVLSGPGNVLEVYEDFPKAYDAWEISLYHKQKHTEIDDVSSAVWVEDGCRRGLRITRKHMDSTLAQTIWFYDKVGKIDFETEVDWKEEHQLLKCAFPVDVNSDKATYEVQFGVTERPTHSNTTWDAMKFEVCGQKFADLSDNGYGVSLLNNCKYGYDIHDGVMRLSLIKCATHPDPLADKCEHKFTYSLYPHAGAWKDGETTRLAYDLNLPMQAEKAVEGTGRLMERYSFFTVSAPNLLAETVKKAYDSEDTVIRLYESANRRTDAKVNFGFQVESVALCDLEENELEELPVFSNSIALTAKPFSLLTLKVKRKKS